MTFFSYTQNNSHLEPGKRVRRCGGAVLQDEPFLEDIFVPGQQNCRSGSGLRRLRLTREADDDRAEWCRSRG